MIPGTLAISASPLVLHLPFTGSQANVGVVQLSSSLPDPGLRIGTGVDSQDGYFLGATQGFEKAALSLIRRRQPESVTGSRYQADSALLQFQSAIAGEDQLRVVLWGLQAEAESFLDDSGGYRFAVNRELEKRDIDDFSVSLNYKRILAAGNLNLQFSHRNKSEAIDTPAVFPRLP